LFCAGKSTILFVSTTIALSFDSQNGEALWETNPQVVLSVTPLCGFSDEVYVLSVEANTAQFAVFGADERGGNVIWTLSDFYVTAAVIPASEGKFYFVNENVYNVITAVEAVTGNIVWNATNPTGQYTTIFLERNTIVFIDSSLNNVGGVDSRSGSALWNVTLNNTIDTTSTNTYASYNGVVVIGLQTLSGPGFATIDAESGYVLWSGPCGLPANSSSFGVIAIAESRIITSTYDALSYPERLYFSAVDLEVGSIIYTTVAPTFPTTAGSLYIANGQFIVPNLEGVTSLDVVTGKMKWRRLINGIANQAVYGNVLLALTHQSLYYMKF